MSIYKFKSNGSTPEDSIHYLDIEQIKIGLLYRVVFQYNETINKEYMEKLYDKLKKFIEEEYEKNQKDIDLIGHFLSINIHAEMLQKFLFLEFGSVDIE